jgi:hypothetical protein
MTYCSVDIYQRFGRACFLNFMDTGLDEQEVNSLALMNLKFSYQSTLHTVAPSRTIMNVLVLFVVRVKTSAFWKVTHFGIAIPSKC